MPKENNVRYSGNAVHYTGDDSPVVYNADFTVNFAEKELQGNIVMPDAKDIKLHAHIEGNGFEGVTQERTQTRGGFYGEHASELIGAYQKLDPNNWYMGLMAQPKNKPKVRSIFQIF